MTKLCRHCGKDPESEPHKYKIDGTFGEFLKSVSAEVRTWPLAKRSVLGPVFPEDGLLDREPEPPETISPSVRDRKCRG